jgi:hypothetical protein
MLALSRADGLTDCVDLGQINWYLKEEVPGASGDTKWRRPSRLQRIG